MKPDVLGVVESAYRLEGTHAEWLTDVSTAVYQQLGGGHGLLGFLYEITAEGRLKVGDRLQHQMAVDLAPMAIASVEQMPPDFVRRSFVRCEAVTQSQADDPVAREHAREQMAALESAFGWRDILMLGGMDPSGHGIYLGMWLSEVTKLPAPVRATWSRVAVHLAAAHRLRRRLSAAEALLADSADAVLTPNGRVEHARREAEPKEARALLREAVLEVENARGKLRDRDPAQAVDHWKGLVSSRWTLVDHFESDGKRYVLARRNDVALSGLEVLTARERQAAGYAALGHNNKFIAYEMGIASSTVGVLLHRAARKLGAATRAELVKRYLENAKPESG